MDNRNIVEDLFQAIEKKDYTKSESLMTQDFRLTGVAPDPVGRQEFLQLHKSFSTGCPDFKFNYNIVNTTGNTVNLTVRLSGTQTKDMPAPIPGLHDIPATNKSFKLPEEKIKATVKNGKVSEFAVEPVPDGGVIGILKQLGVEVPEMHHH